MKQKILVADGVAGTQRICAALADDYELFCFDSFAESKRVVEEHPDRFDLVIVGVHFDDSQAIDLLRSVRTINKRLPILVMQEHEFTHIDFSTDARAVCDLLGACDFVKTTSRSDEQAAKELREAVQKCLRLAETANVD